MKTITSLNEISHIIKPVLTVGTFDGVHIGHQKILTKLINDAKAINGSSVLLTFYPHPRLVLNSDNEIKLITTLKEKEILLAEAGLDYLIVLPFSKEFAAQSPEDYIKNVLVDRIGIFKIVIGHDHKFGKERKGDIDLLINSANKYHYEVEEIPVLEIDHINVSSTKIRNAILSGDIKTADLYLNKPFQLNGIIGKGKQIGRTIGFPTANMINVDNHKIIPKKGVYAGYVTVKGEQFMGMMNIGNNPTVSIDSAKISIEIHILHFNMEVYEQAISFDFVSYLRDELKFNSIDQLKQQLLLDAKETQERLAH